MPFECGALKCQIIFRCAEQLRLPKTHDALSFAIRLMLRF